MTTKSRPVGDQNILVVESVSYDSNGNQVTDSSGAPAVSVVLKDNIGATGTQKSYTMLPDDDDLTDNATDGDTEVLLITAGCYQVIITPIDTNTGPSLLVGTSTAAVSDDGAALCTVLNSFDDDVTTPDGTGHTGVIQVAPDAAETRISWDGTNTIKQIALRLNGTTGNINRRYTVRTVE